MCVLDVLRVISRGRMAEVVISSGFRAEKLALFIFIFCDLLLGLVVRLFEAID